MGILLPIISEFDSKGIDKAVKEFQALEGAGAKAGFALKKAALPAAAAIAGLAAGLGSATKAAMEDAAAQEHLAGVLKRSGMATDDQIAINEKLLSVMSRSAAVADDDLRPALATLVQSTGSLEYSQELLSAALDISASTGKDLSTVTDALSKAYNGNMKGLKALDASLIPLIADGQSFDDVMVALAGTTGGAAADAANTAAGQMKNFGIQMAEAKESIGAALLPAVEKLMGVLVPLATMAQEHTTLFLIFAGVIGSVSVAILAVNFALKAQAAYTKIAAAAQFLFNAAMSANPIALVVIAIAALVAAFVLAYQKSETFRTGVQALFSAISNGVEFSVNVIKGYLTTVLNFYKSIFNTIANLWNNSIGKLSFKFPSWVPGLGGSGFSVPQIPQLAEGGIVTGPTLAMIGESGPEAVIPLNRLGGGGNGITVNVMGGLATSAEIGQAVVNAIRAYNRSAGPANIAVA
jgi:hypothetical protein